MTKLTTIPRLISPLRRGALRRKQTEVTVELPPAVVLLRQWQSARLSRTHEDLLQSPQFGAACRFFLDEIYAPKDFSQRDHDLMQVYETMNRVFPRPMVQTLTKVIRLNTMTIELDQHLLQVLVDEIGMTNNLSEEMYADAYQRCQNYEKRMTQIDLIVDLGQSVHRLVQLPFISLSLRLAHGPAHWAGWAELQTFLENGFVAFKKMKDVSPFLACIETREKKILDNIYNNRSNPFK